MRIDEYTASAGQRGGHFRHAQRQAAAEQGHQQRGDQHVQPATGRQPEVPAGKLPGHHQRNSEAGNLWPAQRTFLEHRNLPRPEGRFIVVSEKWRGSALHCRAPRSGLCPEVGFDTTPGGRGDMFARMPCGWLWVPDLCGLALISVGASLLAMAECQSTMVLDVVASSRASSLPQGIWVVHGFCARQKSKCGSELARDGGISGNQNLRSENSPPTDSTAPPVAPARYKPSMSIANSPRLAGSGC
ncbi:hypothetical protein D3C87_1293090 [compost metagenome]